MLIDFIFISWNQYARGFVQVKIRGLGLLGKTVYKKVESFDPRVA